MRRAVGFSFLAALAAMPCIAWATDAVEERPPFPAMEVEMADGTVFAFSPARATSTDPVFIAVVGRPATTADRVHRVGLQREWISEFVPESYEIVTRDHVVCDAPGRWSHKACDLYTFRDPATGREHGYYLFLGNWPR